MRCRFLFRQKSASLLTVPSLFFLLNVFPWILTGITVMRMHRFDEAFQFGKTNNKKEQRRTVNIAAKKTFSAPGKKPLQVYGTR